MRHIRLKHVREFNDFMEDFRKKFIETYTVEERLAGLSTEEILAKLSH